MAPLEGSLQRVALLTTFYLLVQRALSGLTCEELPLQYCAFSVSSEGMRCVLEKYVGDTRVKLECEESGVRVDNGMGDFVETDECIKACGLQRNWIGISSDSLVDPNFTQLLCSSSCYQACPNIVDLFFNLAAAEGVFLPKLCEVVKGSNFRRGMMEIKSSGLEGIWIPPDIAPALGPCPDEPFLPIYPFPFPPSESPFAVEPPIDVGFPVELSPAPSPSPINLQPSDPCPEKPIVGTFPFSPGESPVTERPPIYGGFPNEFSPAPSPIDVGFPLEFSPVPDPYSVEAPIAADSPIESGTKPVSAANAPTFTLPPNPKP